LPEVEGVGERGEWAAKGHKKSSQNERYVLHPDCGMVSGLYKIVKIIKF